MKHVLKIVVSILVTCVVAQVTLAADIIYNDNVISIKQLETDYDEAKLKIEFYFSDRHSGRGNLHLFSRTLETDGWAHKLKPGLNTIVVYVFRGASIKEEHITKSLTVNVYDELSGNTVYQNDVDVAIKWPGPDYVREVIGDTEIKNNDFSSITSFTIERDIADIHSIYKSILTIGLPIFSLHKDSYHTKTDEGDDLHLYIGESIDVESTKKIVAAIIHSTKHLRSISIERKTDDGFLVGSNNLILKRKSGGLHNKIAPDDLIKLQEPTITANEFDRIIGYTRPSQEEYINSLIDKANKLIDTDKSGDLKRAKVILNEIMTKDPSFPRAYLEMARYHMKATKDFYGSGLPNAEKSILIAKEIDPRFSDTRVLLGYVYTKQGRYKEADNEYKLAEKLGTDNLWLYANWGLNHQKQGMIEKALNMYLKVLAQPRQYDRNDRAIKWTQATAMPLLISEKKYNKVDELYGRFATIFPEYLCTLHNRARVQLYYLGDFQSAINNYLHAEKNGCKLSSSILSIAYYLKWLTLVNNGDTQEATFTYRQAEALSPKDTTILLDLATTPITADVIPLLQSKGKNIDTTDSDGYTALGRAAIAGSLEKSANLIKYGSDINFQSDKKHLSPFMLAAMSGHVEIVKLMLDYNPNLSKRLPNGMHLHIWLKENRLEEISKLLQYGDVT